MKSPGSFHYIVKTWFFLGVVNPLFFLAYLLVSEIPRSRYGDPANFHDLIGAFSILTQLLIFLFCPIGFYIDRKRGNSLIDKKDLFLIVFMCLLMPPMALYFSICRYGFG